MADGIDLQPLVSIVQVSDLHVKSVRANAAHALGGKLRVLQRLAYHALRRRNVFGWEEGTHGHLPCAPDNFADFLRRWRNQLDDELRSVPVWLLDTGDLTAFGDPDSRAMGHGFLQSWSRALGGCPVRSIYGNHDAWPGTQPILRPGKISQQRQSVEATPGWQPSAWINSPLSVNIPGTTSTLSLHAINTVCWGSVRGMIRNAMALGSVDQATVRAMEGEIVQRSESGDGGFRILALHHPVSFPWDDSETGMRLIGSQRHAERFGNARHRPQAFGPWFHLLLSGHTHLRFPADDLTGEVTQVTQQFLQPSQLQLVAGPLMLNRSVRQTRNPSTLQQDERGSGHFSHARVDPRTCQAQILQFFAIGPGRISMSRSLVVSGDGGVTYDIAAESRDLVHFCY